MSLKSPYIYQGVVSLLLLGSLFMAGCAGSRLDVNKSTTELNEALPQEWAVNSVAKPDTTMPLSTHFLHLVDDPQLNELVTEALTTNPDLRATAHRLEASYVLLQETRAIRLPIVEAGASVNRHNQAIDLTGGGDTKETSYRASGGVSWEIDLWGRLKNLHNQNSSLTASYAADYAAARDVLGARVIQSWVHVIALDQSLQIEQDRLQLLEQLQQTIQRRYLRGIGNLDDLAAARTSTEITEASMASLEESYNQSVRAIEVMMGRMPRANLITAESLPAIQEVNTGIPATAIAQRMDVQAALSRLEAADAGAAAAAKDRLPAIRLTGSYAEEGTSISKVFKGKPIWNIAQSLSQPLFQGGLLNARAKARRLELEAAWDEYQAVVLRALGEVEDGLGRERSLITQRNHLHNALLESVRNTGIFEDRYRRGIVSIMELIQARDQEMNLKKQLVALDAELLSNRITLALAVGAGFAATS